MKSPYFLNVDLEIESKSSLRSLERELGGRILVMFAGRMKGRHWLCLEKRWGDDEKGHDAIIALCALVESLSPRNRQLWDTALRKEFDIGYESRLSSERANRFRIRSGTLRRMAALGASFAVTFYRDTTGEPGGAANASQPVRTRTNRTSSRAGSRR